MMASATSECYRMLFVPGKERKHQLAFNGTVYKCFDFFTPSKAEIVLKIGVVDQYKKDLKALKPKDQYIWHL